MRASRPVAVVSALATALVLSGCGGDDGGGDATAGTSASSSSSSSPSAGGSAATSPPGTDGDEVVAAPPFPADAQPDTAEPSAGAALTVTSIRTGRHDGFDRVVLDVAGTGTPGWDVRYVPQASSQGSGAPIAVTGSAILQVTLTGMGYPTETGIPEYGGATVPGDRTAVVTEVVWDTTFEGTSVAFVGTRAQQPFRVFLLQDPLRVVVDVVHG